MLQDALVSLQDKKAVVQCPGAGSSRLSTVGLNSYFRSSRQSTASVAPAGPPVRRAMPKQAAHRRGSSLSGSSPDVLGGLIDTVNHTHALLEHPTPSPHSIYSTTVCKTVAYLHIAIPPDTLHASSLCLTQVDKMLLRQYMHTFWQHVSQAGAEVLLALCA